jgi:zinc D-Ala-D-Ala carboxypeptidase
LKVGGVFNSSHKKGLAVDISTNGSDKKYIVLNALIKVGFTRFGIGNTFIHVDADKEKSQNVIWTY